MLGSRRGDVAGGSPRSGENGRRIGESAFSARGLAASCSEIGSLGTGPHADTSASYRPVPICPLSYSTVHFGNLKMG